MASGSAALIRRLIIYWAVDDVVVRTPLAPLPGRAKATALQVFSDIQGEGLPYLDDALDLLDREAPKAGAMLVAGDQHQRPARERPGTAGPGVRRGQRDLRRPRAPADPAARDRQPRA
ncbi:hypothetical protein [Nonomuraea jiangxiensis]|uniref:hypothetical protein n=1 Tax=Nonomuraea jiangxiensis TaxID=633440 RepID=UPI00115FA8DE|nr:hypothetical protein [Nonomuraea jiangxiensis]